MAVSRQNESCVRIRAQFGSIERLPLNVIRREKSGNVSTQAMLLHNADRDFCLSGGRKVEPLQQGILSMPRAVCGAKIHPQLPCSTRQVLCLRLLDLRCQFELAVRHLHLAELAVSLAQQKMCSVAVCIERKGAQQRALRLLITALTQ